MTILNSFLALPWYWMVAIVVVIVAAAFLLWYIVPIWMVRRHDLQHPVDRIQHEDSARKTLGAALTGIGVVLPLAVSAVQFVATMNMQRDQDQRDFMHKTGGEFAAALEKFTKADTDIEVKIQLIYDLERLALSVEGPPEHFIIPIADNLKRLIGKHAKFERNGEGPPAIFARYGCAKDAEGGSGIRERNDRDHLVRAAFGSLGRLRARAQFPIQLDDLQFDNIDVAKQREDGADSKVVGQSYAGAHFSGAYFRRADLTGASFERADFRDAHLGDDEMPHFSDALALKLYAGDDDDELRKYRCWISDLRKTVFTGADFRRANLAGADFRGAWLNNDKHEARFNGAIISRADLRGTNVTLKQLCSAQWDHRFVPKNDVGLKSRAQCPKDGK